MRWTSTALLVLALAPPAAAQMDSPPLGAVLANGYRFTYAERGSGAPLLLVHGALTDYRFWQGQLDSLSNHFRVIALSRRYHYPNPWRAEDPPSGFATTAADLAAVIRALRLDRPVVVGHSWAALAVLELERRYPDLVGGIVLVNPVADSLIGDPGRRHQVAMARRRAYEAALAVFDPRAPRPALNRLLAAWFGPASNLEALAPDTRDRLLANAHTLPSAAAPQPPLDCALLGTLTAPALLLGSDNAPPEEQETLAALGACLPRGRAVTVPGGGRTLPRTRPGPFDTLLREFMQAAAP